MSFAGSTCLKALKKITRHRLNLKVYDSEQSAGTGERNQCHSFDGCFVYGLVFISLEKCEITSRM